jgi:D-glycero-beta-D-manno-heptose-7-phosphate kinase
MTIHQVLALFRQKKILVVGDVMIDAYLIGKVNRISPEAPVPIVSLQKEEQRLGGAANVALNLKSLGAETLLCSVVGNDKKGKQFVSILENETMQTKGIYLSDERVTTVKTRVLGNNQQLLRIDEEDTFYLSEKEETAFLKMVKDLISTEKIDALIFEDYNKGVLSKKVISELISLANEKGIPTAVDPKKVNFFAYQGVTLFKPNLKELKEGVDLNCSFENREKFDKAIQILEEKLENKISFVTLSENGVFIKEGGNSSHQPAHIRNIADVSGAGDTVISVATLALAAGLSIESIAELSNLAGGLVCEKSGVVSIDPNQLIEECEDKEWN